MSTNEPLHVTSINGDVKSDERKPEGGVQQSALSSAGELRAEIDRLSGIVADVVSKRAQQAYGAAEDGVGELRSTLRQYPWTAVAVAGLGGALIAFASIPKRQESIYSSRRLARLARRHAHGLQAAIPSYLPSVNLPAFTVSDTVSDINTRPVTSRLEKMADAITDLDSSALSSAVTGAQRWFNTLKKSS